MGEEKDPCKATRPRFDNHMSCTQRKCFRPFYGMGLGSELLFRSGDDWHWVLHIPLPSFVYCVVGAFSRCFS